MRRRRPALLALVLSVAAVAAGCGGADDERARERSPVTTAASDADLAVPEPLRIGWKTDFTRATVPYGEIQSGGPGKDDIPPVDRPRFEAPAAVDWLGDREPVIELVLGDAARAYPLQIMTWHEIVNDVVDGRPVAVTFCPLCNTAIVFDRRLDGRLLDFGTTGNLRHSDLVMYDRQSESWWQQFSGEAIVGELAGAELEQVAARIVSWKAFREAHPDGEVLSRDTGHERRYGENPYSGYDDVDRPPIFQAANADDDRLPPKERVVFVARGGDAIAVPFAALARRGTVRAEVGGDEVVVTWRGGVASALDTDEIAAGRDVGSATVTVDGKPFPFSEPFWFAVAAFRADVRIVR